LPATDRSPFFRSVRAFESLELSGWPFPTTKSGSVATQRFGSPAATFERPMTNEPYACAVVPMPNAAEERPLATVAVLNAAEYTPILESDHPSPSVSPTRNAAFAGYHIIRVPAPEAGIVPGPGAKPGMDGPVPVKSTPLSLETVNLSVRLL